MRRFHVGYAVGGFALLAVAPLPLLAQGFSVNEHSTCAMGRAGTAVALPCPDGSAIVFNPAGMAELDPGKTHLSVGGTFIAPKGDFTDDVTGARSKLKNKVFPVPSVYLTRALGTRFGAGLGLFAPYGLTTDWPVTSQGRFLGYKSVIKAVYIQPTVGAKLGRYASVGGGVDFNFLHLQLRQRLDLATQLLPAVFGAPPGSTFEDAGVLRGTDFADANLTANGTGVGFHAGILLKPTDRISFGVRYLSRQTITIKDGEASFSQVNTNLTLGGVPLDQALALRFVSMAPLSPQSAATKLRMPDQLTLGTAVKVNDQVRLLFDYTMQNWEVFDTLKLKFSRLDPLGNGTNTELLPQDFRKSHAFRFGGEYDVCANTTLRLGYLTHTGAAPDRTVTPNLPEGGRAEFTAGVGSDLGNRVHVDLAYQYIDQGDRRGRTAAIPTPSAQGLVLAPAPNNGLYHFTAHLFAATVAFAL